MTHRHGQGVRQPRPSHTGCGGLDHLAIAAEQHETVERPGEPAVVGHRDDGAVEALQPLLQRLGAGQVQVVRRLVEQQQGRPGQLQQQHQEPGLLAAGEGAEALVGLAGQLVAGQRLHRLAAGAARCASRRPARGSPPASCPAAPAGRGSARSAPAVPGRRAGPTPPCSTGASGARRPACARRPGRCRPGRAAAGNATCRCRWRRARRPGRRTRSPGRTGTSGPPAPAART